MRIAAITGGENVPSRRFRIDALKPYLKDHGHEVTEFCPAIECYPPPNRLLRPAWLIAALAERSTYCWKTRGFDRVILQRELISSLPTLEGFLPNPKILDVDDATFLHRNGSAARHCARHCEAVVCGNDWLADRFSQWNTNVCVIPTGVDTRHLSPLTESKTDRKPVVGWIGTSGNLRFLEPMAQGIADALHTVNGAVLHIVADSIDPLPKVLLPYVNFTRWQPDIERLLAPEWTVGIMPLKDDDWSRGKCAFKLLQYLAAGVPAVGSPVGANKSILDTGRFGVTASTNDEWKDALVYLLSNPEHCHEIGAEGRQFIEENYSLHVVARKWSTFLNENA